MAATAVLSMLYEILVAESRYEVRGSQYRTRLKELYDDMMKTQTLHGFVQVKCVRQSLNKLIEELVDSVGLLAYHNVEQNNIDICAGIRQYVFPRIPEFTQLDSAFVLKWKLFYGVPLSSGRMIDRSKHKKQNLRDSKKHRLLSPTAKRACVKKVTEVGNPPNPEVAPVIITAEDFEIPLTSSQNPNSDRAYIPVKHPAKTLKEQKKLENTKFLGKAEDKPVREFPILVNKVVETGYDKDHSVIFGLMEDDYLKTDWASCCSYDSYNSMIMGMLQTDKQTDFDESTSSKENDRDSEAFESVSQCTTDYFDENAIFGNYYCPLLGGINGSIDVDDLSTALKSRKLENNKSSSMICKTFTCGQMEVKSMYSCGKDGILQVECTGSVYVGPYKRQENLKRYDVALDENPRKKLNSALSELFAIKSAICGDCKVCDGWNLLDGNVITFCELCEENLLNESDLSVVTRIFEIRRSLISRLYPALGYKFHPRVNLADVKDVFNPFKLTENNEGTMISIQTLCEIGGSYPRATLHDGRFSPNCFNLSLSMLDSISTLPYPRYEETINPKKRHKSQFLMICMQRIRNRAEMLNGYLETLYNMFQSRSPSRRSSKMISDYTNVLKGGLLPCNMMTTNNTEQNYFDELVSYTLTRLPLDDNLIKNALYYRGIYSIRPQGIKSAIFLPIAEYFGFNLNSAVEYCPYRWNEILLKSSVRKSSLNQTSPSELGDPAISEKIKYTVEILKRTGLWMALPNLALWNVQETGRLFVGFPTSLEMQVMQIPDAALDPSMYGDVGKALLYSFPALLQNMVALAPIIKVGTCNSFRRRVDSKS